MSIKGLRISELGAASFDCLFDKPVRSHVAFEEDWSFQGVRDCDNVSDERIPMRLSEWAGLTGL